MRNWNPRSIIAVMLAATVSFILISGAIAAYFRPPDQVTDTFRQRMFEAMLVLIGIVSGFMLRGGNEKR